MSKTKKAQRAIEKAEYEARLKKLTASYCTKLDELQSGYLNYRDGALQTANNQASELIGKAIIMAQEIGETRMRSTALNLALEEKSIALKGSPSILTKLIKAMCGSDQKRASTLARVAEVAMKEEIAAADIAKWVKQKGGFEEIRMANSKSGAPRSKLTSLGKTIVENSEAATTFERCAVTPKQAGDAIFFGFVNNDGETELYASIQNESLQKAFYEQLGRSQWKNSKEVDKTKTVSDIIDDITNEIDEKEKAA